MSRTRRGGKGPGYDYSGRRRGNTGCTCPTAHKGTKKMVHTRERSLATRLGYKLTKGEDIERAERDAD